MPTSITIKESFRASTALARKDRGVVPESYEIPISGFQGFNIEIPDDTGVFTNTHAFNGSEWFFYEDSYSTQPEVPPVYMKLTAVGLPSNDATLRVNMNPDDFSASKSISLTLENPTVILYTNALWAFLSTGITYYESDGTYTMAVQSTLDVPCYLQVEYAIPDRALTSFEEI